MVSGAAPPPFVPAFDTGDRLDRPCTTCRWRKRNLPLWLDRLLVSHSIEAQCLQPTVLAGVVNQQPFLIPDYVITKPDPVTGTPGRVTVLCSLARSNPRIHSRGQDRAPPEFLCGPPGRYWEPIE